MSFRMVFQLRFVHEAVFTCGRSRRGRAARAADRSRRAHHVIPKSLLKAQGYETGEINEIANMAFITGQTNRRISNKDAAGYLADVVAKQGAAALRSQCVPPDPAR